MFVKTAVQMYMVGKLKIILKQKFVFSLCSPGQSHMQKSCFSLPLRTEVPGVITLDYNL